MSYHFPMGTIKRLIDLSVDETTVVAMILINSAAIFLDAFPALNAGWGSLLAGVDLACVIFFMLEMAIKLKTESFADYWKSVWNRFDGLVVVLSLPTLVFPLATGRIFSAILLLRLGRLFRFFKLLKFIPQGRKMWLAVLRAMRASVAVFLTLMILNLLLGVGASILFGENDPVHFGDPLRSCYSVFKIFTLEGWYNVPDQIADAADAGGSAVVAWFVRLYFIATVLVGFLTLALANAVFVDEMTADNTDKVEQMVALLHADLNLVRQEHLPEQAGRIASIEAKLDRLMERLDKPSGKK